MDALVQVEAVVSHGDGTPPQASEDAALIIIEANTTADAPQGPSSKSVAFSHYNHISAQLPLDPATGAVVADEATQCLTNIQAIVESVDHALEDVVKVNIALTSSQGIDAVDEVYSRFFPGGVPARRIIGVSALPGDAGPDRCGCGNAEGTPPVA